MHLETSSSIVSQCSNSFMLNKRMRHVPHWTNLYLACFKRNFYALTLKDFVVNKFLIALKYHMFHTYDKLSSVSKYLMVTYLRLFDPRDSYPSSFLAGLDRVRKSLLGNEESFMQIGYFGSFFLTK